MSDLRAARLNALAAVTAALIGAVALVIVSDDDSPDSSADKSCVALIQQVRDLRTTDPDLAAELAKRGDSELPQLWDDDTMDRCGGVDPERLLERLG